jgi:hypothetical protein
LWMLGKNPGMIPRYLIGMMFLGGLMGLPGMEDMEDIAKALAWRMGKDFDVERFVHKMVAEVLGDDFPTDYILRGTSRRGVFPAMAEMAGVSLDAPGMTVFPHVDMSRSIGFGRVLPFNPATFLGSPGKSFEEGFSKAAERSAGAAFSAGFNIYKAGYDWWHNGYDMKAWERALPRSLKNATRAARMLYEGGESLRTGAEIMDFEPSDPRSWGEAAAIVGGFPLTRESQTWDRFMAQKEVENFWMAKREYVLDQLWQARDSGDAEAMSAAREAMARFNSETPYPAARIKRDTRRRSWESRRESIRAQERWRPQTKLGKQVSREVNELFKIDPPRRLDNLAK